MAEVKRTYCRICEPKCGLLATVEGPDMVMVRPDPEHPMSQGFACQNGLAIQRIVDDPDRVLRPPRRKAGIPAGPARRQDFEEVSWNDVVREIGGRLREVIDRHGGGAVGGVMGQARCALLRPVRRRRGSLSWSSCSRRSSAPDAGRRRQRAPS